jgi:hypothetical protein
MCGGCLGAIGSLVFGIWAVVVLFIYGSALKRTAAAAQVAWSQSVTV